MIQSLQLVFTLSILLFVSLSITAQSLSINVVGSSNTKVYLYSLQGEKTLLIDSVNASSDNNYKYNLEKLFVGFYRLSFPKNTVIDFINDGKDVVLKTDFNNILDSMKVVSSESNKLFYQFIKLNRQYKTKNELLQFILNRFPKDDSYYQQTKERLNELHNEYLEFINITAQKDPKSFIARYIFSSQLPIIDINIPQEKQLDYLKANALNYVDFNDASLINSDLFSNKSIEYLTYFSNPQLPKELLEKEFMKAIDSLFNKAKVNQLVYQHITEYLIDGFKKYGFNQVLDYIVENYVVKDDLCLDEKTEGTIKRRIDQAKYLKVGSFVPEIVLPNEKGKLVELSKINSEKTLIVFYSTWCSHCKELLPKLNAYKKGKPDKALTILAISLDTKREEWEAFFNENCSELINLSDLKGWDGKASNDYYIYATPTMFLIDKEKKIISKPIEVRDILTQ